MRKFHSFKKPILLILIPDKKIRTPRRERDGQVFQLC